jgi:serine/threonine protein phosphatase PrpC/serine/threonine protein kinase
MTASAPSPPWTEIHPSEVLDQRPASSGGGATVLLGTYLSRVVALRVPRITSAAALDRFSSELRLRALLGEHPHVLPLLAACTRPPRYATVSPWMAGGDAFGAVHVRGVRFAFARLLTLAQQIASALAHLHEMRIVHRDVKSANILLSGDLDAAYLTDLDLAISVEDFWASGSKSNGRAMHRGPSNGRLSHMVGTLAYMAPEVLSGAPHGFPADVYAFAVTVNELAAAAVPFVDRELPVPELHTILETRFNDLTLRRAIVRDGLRPVAAPGVPSQFSELIAEAWAADPADRPSISQIAARLDQIRALGDEFLTQFPAATTSASVNASNGDDCAQNGDGLDDDPGLLADLAACHKVLPLPSWSADTGRTTYRPIVTGDVSSTCGKRGADRMEDRAIVQHEITGPSLPDVHLFAVFDGHGGDVCAQYAAGMFPVALSRAWARQDSTPDSALSRAFQDTDAAFLRATPSSEQSGCTALAALIVNSTLYVANAGDCRCVLGHADASARQLTRDHIATDPFERARVEARGGTVDPSTGRVQGRLMVSRSFGDRCIKRYVAATPEITAVELSADTDCIVLASDGLWDVVSSQEAIYLVRSTVRSADLAAKRLVLKAIELGSNDNISVIVVYLDPPWPGNA